MKTIKIPLGDKRTALGYNEEELDCRDVLCFEFSITKDYKHFKGVYIPEDFQINISSIKEKSFVNFNKEKNTSRTDKITPNSKVFLFEKIFDENDILQIKLTNYGNRIKKDLIDLVLFFEE